MLEHAVETEKLSGDNSSKLGVMLFAPMILVPAFFLGGAVSAELTEQHLTELGARNLVLKELANKKDCKRACC
jgi:hypothetical protein